MSAIWDLILRPLVRQVVRHPQGTLFVMSAIALAGLGLRVNALTSKLRARDHDLVVAHQNMLAAQAETQEVQGHYRRLLEQAEVKATELQRELKERPVLTTTVTVTAPTETSSTPTDTVVIDSVGVYTYDLDVAVLEVSVDWVSQLPPIVTVEPKPISLTYVLGCGPNGPTLDVVAGDREVDISGTILPGVCNPVVAPRGRGVVTFVRGALVGAATVLLIGLAIP